MPTLFQNTIALYTVMRDGRKSPAQLKPVVHRRLKRLLVSAYRHVPYYGDVMQSIGYNPTQDYKGVDDLKHFPILTKEVIKSKPPEAFLSDKFKKSSLHAAHTSGSTGTPMIIYREPSARAIQIACWLRVMFLNGYKPTDNTLLVSIFTKADDNTTLMQKLGLFRRSVISMLDSYDELADYILAHKFDVIYGNRSSFYLFAKEFERRSVQPGFIKLLLAGGEVIDDHFRQRCETYLGVRPTEYYGTVETGTLAYETPAQDGLHLFEDQIYYEFLDEDGNSAQPGAPARLIATRMNGEAMPFIRYDVGDIVTYNVINDQNGMSQRILTSIIGRDNELIRLSDGRTLLYQAFAAKLNMFSELRQYRVVQEKPDFFRIIIAGDGEYLKATEKSISPGLDELLGSTSGYTFEHVDEIPLDETGKFRIFISEV